MINVCKSSLHIRITICVLLCAALRPSTTMSFSLLFSTVLGRSLQYPTYVVQMLKEIELEMLAMRRLF